QMSTHPSIVTIHQAEVSDDHRPYIVMEYCPRPNYGMRFRKERITVAEALRVGVQIAGAVETAHRAGILHRDIKPANILVTDYNRPALTDFGISIATGQANDVEDSQGMSIPWSPPEFFADPPRADVRSDVFSLAATVYSLLAGQTPFERRGQRNTASDLVHRIATEPLRPLDRPDVPEELNRVLSIAMAKEQTGRYDTALAFGRSLQQVELSLSLPVTQMDVLDDRTSGTSHSAEDDELDMHTRIRKVATVDPESAGTTGPGARRRLDPYAGVAPALGSLSGPGHAAPPAGVGGTGSAAEAAEATMLRPAGRPLGPAPAAAPLADAAGPPAQDGAVSRTPARLRPRGTPIGPAAAAAPLAGAAGPPEQHGAASRPPAWPFLTRAAVLVVLFGGGASVGVRHFLVPEPEPIATSDITAPTAKPDPPGEPTAIEIQIITPGEGTDPGMVRVTWEPPEGVTQDDHYQVRWKDVPANYADEFGIWRDVYGRNSIAIPVPPQLPE